MRAAYSWKGLHDRFFERFPTRVAADLELFVAINRLPHGSRIDPEVALLSDFGKGAGWTGVATMFALGGGRRGLVAGLAGISAMLAATGLVQGVVKRYFRMRRPYAHELAIEVGARPVDSSFPSGHSAASFAAASALAAYYPAAGPLLLAGAAGVGLSRVYLGHHFPSDVAVGGALGGAIGLLSARLWRRWVG
jgi:undecaprenyl-diphosphatase